jgi:T5SS/PEP-CTERM-associated repeat protein
MQVLPDFRPSSLPRRSRKRTQAFRLLLSALAFFPLTGIAIDYVNGDITSTFLNAGNATYRLSAGYTKAFGSDWPFYLGFSNSNNTLIIEDGACATNKASAYVGYNTSGNSMTITGESSKWETIYEDGGSQYFTVGSSGGSNNSLLVEKGGTLIGIYLAVGLNNSDHNSVVIDGSGSSADFAMAVMVGDSFSATSGNSFTLKNGAALNAGSLYIGRNGTSNTALITGVGTAATLTGGVTVGGVNSVNSRLTISDGAKVSGGSSGTWTLSIGESSSKNSNLLISGEGSSLSYLGYMNVGGDSSEESTLTIKDGGRFLLGSEVKFGHLSFGTGSDAFIRLDGGFFGWYGDRVFELTEHTEDGRFQYWDAEMEQWITGSLEHFKITYLTDLNGSGLTGGRYDDLQGYTLVIAIPEASFWVHLGLALGVFFILRRPHKRTPRAF